jgi:hypothetical protein
MDLKEHNMSDDQLTDQTKAEQEMGRKMAAQNAAAFARAERAREAETAPPPEPVEAQAAVDEALQSQPDKLKPQKGDRK